MNLYLARLKQGDFDVQCTLIVQGFIGNQSFIPQSIKDLVCIYGCITAKCNNKVKHVLLFNHDWQSFKTEVMKSFGLRQIYVSNMHIYYEQQQECQTVNEENWTSVFMKHAEKIFSFNFALKILVIGDVATGKTQIIQRYVYKTFDPNHNATLGVDFALKRVRVDNLLCNLQLWDIAGQERFIGLAPPYYKTAVAAIAVFDITKRETLENVKKWKADVDDKVFLRNGDNIPVVLFANKWDLLEKNEENRTVSDDELNDFCHNNHFVGWFTTSPKTGLNVKKGMNFLINKIIKNINKLEQY